MSYWNSAYMFFVDASGQPCTLQWATQDQSDGVPSNVKALGAAAQSISLARLVAIQYSTTYVIGGSGSTGDYPSVWDRAVLLDRTNASRSYGQIQIPAPVSSIFNADHLTVNMSDAGVMAFVAQVYSTMGDKAGNPITSVYKGQRSRVRSNPMF